MASVKELTAIAKKQLMLRDHLFEGAAPWLWDRKINKGFATIPKTMPLVMNIMDDMTKGAPVSSTFLSLWCSTWDNSFVVINKPLDLAHAAGFGGQRGEHTWAARMKKLQELKFIDFKAGKSGPFNHVIIYNPHFVIRHHYELGTPGLTEASYTALIEAAMDIGAKDMLPDTALPSAPFAPSAASS
ncbi:MAG: hypothetical protein GC155_08265 [Alphaproteobacteria bacterium]|nr:hypothetical protein [Alphaproteobacteria bacterium]